MNKYILKKIRDNIPEYLKYLTATFFRNKLINNNIYNEYINLLHNRELLSEVLIKEYQFVKLKNILIYANDNVPYYTDLFKKISFTPSEMKSIDEINIIPILTKDIIRNNFDKLISSKKVSGGYYIATTGGSTGEPLKILLDYDCVFKENAFVNYYRSKFGYQINDKLATFRGIEFENKLWKFNPMQNELIFSPFKLSQKTLLIYLKKINKYKPHFLNGYLSTIYLFAKLLQDNNLNLCHTIKGIFLISENINIEQRDFVENFFHVKTSTFYGHSERCIIAEEYSPNLYDFDPYYGFTELLTTNNNYYEIIGTGFLNKTMPLIRYKTDDLCLKSNNLFTIKGSRKSNIGMYGYNGEFISQASFNFHTEIFNNVVNYQFLQKHKGKVKLLLVVNKCFTSNEIPLILNEINKKTKGIIDFEIQVVDKLVLSKRGKFKMFISDL